MHLSVIVVVTRFSEISRKMKVPWSEYWVFLNSVVDIETADGLHQFEVYLRRHLKELIERRAAERQHHELLQNTSICQLMQLLNLSDSSHMHSSEVQSDSHQDNGYDGILSDIQDTVCTTWPPALAKLRPCDSAAANVAENCQSTEAQILSNRVGNVDERNGSDDAGKPSDSLSACSSDSFHTADDDSDFEFDLVSDWPDDFDWQAVEPLFIYG